MLIEINGLVSFFFFFLLDISLTQWRVVIIFREKKILAKVPLLPNDFT